MLMRTLILYLAMLTALRAQTLPEPKNWTAAEDHRNMMEQLGIKALRPGPSGNENAPNHANYDETLANPYPQLPDALTLKNGKKVASAKVWRDQRSPEIVEDFEREVLGRVPKNSPKVTWTVTKTVHDKVGAFPVIGRQVVGHVDNAAAPSIAVDIQLILVTPENANRKVPVMIMFRGGGLPGAPPPPMPPGFKLPPSAAPPSNDPPAPEQLIADGWGYAFLNPTAIQPDNGAGLTKGVIGLVNRGQPRKPEDWGALRAWAWGASRALDYMETDATVDSKRVGIEGVSRYGKAALVTMAMDTRFAIALVGSSGEGGAKLHRRNFGEAVESLTGSGEYHWMAGNFLKYGTAESSFGSKNANDIPVDAHELIALCAPRPTFISYGVPEKGDAKWLDQQGSFMATVAAGPVFRLLGAKAVSTSDDYTKQKMPPANVSLLDGQLAWRQHDGGHTDGPNWKYFIPWADMMLAHTPPADRAMARPDSNSARAHEQLLAKAKQGRIDIYFEGDSITRRWGATDYPELLANWKKNFFGWNAADFGWGADSVQHILWRLRNGELDGVKPKAIVLLAGTNNLSTGNADPESVVRGIQAAIAVMQEKAPEAVILLTAIFPRNDIMTLMPTIHRVNEKLARLADGNRIRFVNINGKLADANDRLLPGVAMPDKLHLAVGGYQVWAEALKPIFLELLGPPASEDHAPAPTGDPSKAPLI